MRFLPLLASLWLASTAAGEPTRLRLATVAPEGSGWARAMHASSLELEGATSGQLRAHWYLGGIAGDEMKTVERLRRGQLDGLALSIGCDKLAPSLRVMRIPGLTRSRAEGHFLHGQLTSRVERELRAQGLALLALGEFGSLVLLSRAPVRRFDELERVKLWTLDHDEVWTQLLRAMGLTLVTLPIEEAGRAYDDGRVDGFITVPAAALVFQWTTQARWFTDLNMGILPACFVMSQAALDALPIDQQNALRTVAARFGERFESEAERTDRQLLDGLMERQGLRRAPPDAVLRDSFYQAAQQARDTGANGLVDPELLNKVLGWLADYRAMHSSPR